MQHAAREQAQLEAAPEQWQQQQQVYQLQLAVPQAPSAFVQQGAPPTPNAQQPPLPRARPSTARPTS